MRILIFNWKDIRHPLAGGAEIVTHEFAKHFCLLGHSVTIFCSISPGLREFEIIDNVKIVRRGSLYSRYFYALLSYFTEYRHKIDIIIDQIHGIPYLTPIYVRKPIVSYIHEIAGPIWFKEFPWFIAVSGYLFEKMCFKYYQNVLFVTDSVSTHDELVKYGVTKKNIKIITLPIKKISPIISKRSKEPMLLYIGGIRRMKRLEMLLQATSIIIQKIPNVQLIIAGKGNPNYLEKLRQDMVRLKLRQNVLILGEVNEQSKYELYARSWLHIHPSMKEGYGLTVLESATQSTPTVCFDVGGLRDLVQDGVNGIVVKSQTETSLAEAIITLISNKPYLRKLSKKTRQWINQFPTWNEQAQIFNDLLYMVYHSYQKTPNRV